MLEKEFVSYNLAMELKGLRFDEECFGYWGISRIPQTEGEIILETRQVSMTGNLSEKICLAPTFSQAFKWFRKEHKLFECITPTSYEIWDLTINQPIFEKYPIDNIKTPCEPVCLLKLIDLVKEKSK